MRFRLAAALLVPLCSACGSDGQATDPPTATIGFTFAYKDGRGLAATIAADSGTWYIDQDSKIVFDVWGAGAEFLGPVVEVFFTNRIAVPGAPFLSPGTYAIGDTLANDPYMVALARDVAGAADGGTITITKNDATILAGSVDAVFHSWRGVDGMVFTLRGPFRLTYRPLAPGAAGPAGSWRDL